MKDIVLCLNNSDSNESAINAINNACNPAEHKIHICCVPERLPKYASFPSKERYQKLSTLLAEEAAKQISSAKTQLEAAGFGVETRVLSGRFPESILDYAKQVNAESIVKSPSPSSTKHLSKGDKKFVRECQRPILIARDGMEQVDNIFTGLAISPYDDKHLAFCQAILKSAAEKAKQFNAKLHIAHVWSIMGKSLLQSRMQPEEMAKLVTDHETLHKEALDKVMNSVDLTGVNYEVHLEYGDHTSVLTGLIDKTKSELVIAGSVGRSGVVGYVIGNTAEAIIEKDDCSVLILHP